MAVEYYKKAIERCDTRYESDNILINKANEGITDCERRKSMGLVDIGKHRSAKENPTHSIVQTAQVTHQKEVSIVKYEYKVLEIIIEKLEKKINELGAVGWEVVGYAPGGNQYWCSCVLKRIKA